MQTAETANAPLADSRQRRRAVPIVDAKFQWKYTILIMALGVGVMGVMGGFLYRSHVENTRVLDLGANEALREQVAQNDQSFLLILVATIVAMGIMLSLWGLIVTHRISGPLYIVARYMQSLAGGQYPDMRPLRKRDELQSFFAVFEETVGALKARDEAAVRDIEAAVTAARKTAETDPKAALEGALRMLEQRKDAHAKLLIKG